MSTLVERVKSLVEKVPFIQNGTKLTPTQAELAIWKSLSDPRIGIQKDDPQTHSLLDPALISERDIRTVFCDENKIALPCIRAFMKEILATTQEEVKVNASSDMGKVLEAITANKPIGQYKTKELLEKYDADAAQEIWDELEKRAAGCPCIVFNGGKVNIDVSLKLMQDLRKGIKTGTVYNDGNKAYRVYPVGVFPEESALCCPVTGKILNNGYCSELGVSWNGVSEDCLVFIRIIRDQNASEKINKFSAKALVKAAMAGGLDALRADYPEEAMVYDDLKSLNQLPSLRVSLNSMAAGRKVGRASDPFGSPRRS